MPKPLPRSLSNPLHEPQPLHEPRGAAVQRQALAACEGSVPTVLTIAGTDPTGGAGLQADIKAIGEAGAFAFSVVTALVAQNTQGVREIFTPPLPFLRAQLDAVFDDVRVDGVKVGMLGTTAITRAVRDYLEHHRPPVVVVDPVMVATSGDRLLDAEAVAELRRLCGLATVITPNLHELADLAGTRLAGSLEEAVAQAEGLAGELGCAVLVKGGHLAEASGNRQAAADNFWVTAEGAVWRAPARRVPTSNTHGTGCSLSSALAGRLAAGDEPGAALRWATDWLAEAIAHADELRIGHGCGPVDHTHRSRRLVAAADTTPWPEVGAIPASLETPEHLAAAAPRAVEAPGLHDRPHPADAGHKGGANGLESQQDFLAVEAPLIAAAGPWTAALWRHAVPLARACLTDTFVGGLVTGALPRETFEFYLAQNARYLEDYSRALARLGASAPATDRPAWLADAQATIELEAAMHRDWLGLHSPASLQVPDEDRLLQGAEPSNATYLEDAASPARAAQASGNAQPGVDASPAGKAQPVEGIQPSPVTLAYTSFLLARTHADAYVVGAAAVLPCYWFYAQVGAGIQQRVRHQSQGCEQGGKHPYQPWIDMYADVRFAQQALGAIERVERAFAAAEPTDRARAARAFVGACRYEREFFDQAARRGVDKRATMLL